MLTALLEYLEDTITEPVPRYIYLREIKGLPADTPECRGVYEEVKTSKWYLQLKNEQREDGSFGRFHSMDSKDPVKRIFKTTENAVRRIKDLALPKEDPVVDRTLSIMSKYVNNDAKWSDRIEHHFGFEVALNSMVAANMALLGSDHPLVLKRKELCAKYLEAAYSVDGIFNRQEWDKLNHQGYDLMLAPEIIHMIWLLYENHFISDIVLRKFATHLWDKKDGIYYLSGFSPSNHKSLESKYFMTWLHILEQFSGLSLFPELMQSGAADHLYIEALRIINQDSDLPKGDPVYGHYHETWRKTESRNCDLILRIVRILSKCWL